MKHFCVFLCAAPPGGRDFTTGGGQRAVVGQTTFAGALAGASQTLIGAASGLAYKNGTLFVADSNRLGAGPINNRILIYHGINSRFPAPTEPPPGVGLRCPACGGKASLVLGQANFTTTDPGASQSGMQLPTDVATDGAVLAVADTNNNRVLIWKTIRQPTIRQPTSWWASPISQPR
jgi:hypothetical protein